jgi:major membrane immunogen (membrane-anchored lipoprotein)
MRQPKKTTSQLLCIIMLTMFISTSISKGQEIRLTDRAVKDTTVSYKDGTYEGQSRAKYVYEPFWGSVRFTLKNGIFTDINFTIRDSSLHETFYGKYEKHFEGNPEYIQQSRNDWKGVQTYPKKLSGQQDINKIDAISGATWSYNIFRASVNEALKNSK